MPNLRDRTGTECPDGWGGGRQAPSHGAGGGPSRLVPAHRPCVTSGGEALDPTSQRGQCLIGQPTGGQSEQASNTARGIAGETADLRFHQITRPGRPGPPLDREIQRSASPTWTRRPAPPRTIFYWGTGKAAGGPAPAKSARAELWMTGDVRRLEWTRAVDRAAGLAGSFASEVRMAWYDKFRHDDMRWIAFWLAAIAGLLALLISSEQAPAQTAGVREIAGYQGPDRTRRLLEGAKREGTLTLESNR